jgi:hypothetical protein
VTEEAPPGETPAGWYPNPSGAPGIRYFDGREWTGFHRPAPPAAPMAPPGTVPHPHGYVATYPGQMPSAVIVTGPNHALHAVLTLFTFWACGGWAWIWLIVAIGNRRQIHVIPTPPPPYR